MGLHRALRPKRNAPAKPHLPGVLFVVRLVRLGAVRPQPEEALARVHVIVHARPKIGIRPKEARVLVLRDGRLAGSVEPSLTTQDQLLRLMAGLAGPGLAGLAGHGLAGLAGPGLPPAS